MLVLSRKVGERIHVGDNITVEIRRIAGNRVTLALDAPRDVRILRGELQQAAGEFQARQQDEVHASDSEYEVIATRVKVTDDLPTRHVAHNFFVS